MSSENGGTDGTGRLVESLARHAMSCGVPGPVAAEAGSATAERFRGLRGPSRSRVDAYFWGVIRRRVLRGGAPAMRQRLLLTSFVEELTAAGHAPSRVYEELRRVYGATVDPTLLEAFRPGSPANAA